MMRTHRAGDLRAEHIGAEVVVCGWVAHRRDHGGVVFLDVRDASGFVQVVVDPDAAGCGDAHRVRNEWVLRVDRHGAAASRGCGQRRAADRRDRGRGDRGRGAQRVGAAAVPARRSGRRRRGAAAPSPLPRPAAGADAAQPAFAGRGEPRAARGDARAGLRRDRDADADRVDARGRARLRRTVAAAAGNVLRAAAEPAAVQAAADGRRPRPLLPDRALPRATKTCAPIASSSSCSSTSR